MSASPGTKIAVAAGVILVLVLYFSFVRRPAEPVEQAGGTSAARQQVEQRLRQLHAAHDRTGHRGEHDAGVAMNGGKIEARSGVAAQPKGLPHARAGAAATDAPDAGDTGDAELDVDPDDTVALANIALHDKDPERRLAAVTMLGSSDDPAVLTTLSQALSDEDDEVRMAAIQSLSDFTGDAPVDLLSKVVVDDPSPDNRYEALEALSDLGGDRATSAIQKALNDPDEDVRALAEGMLDMEETYQDSTENAPEAATPATTPAP